jgi:hypothetical protein
VNGDSFYFLFRGYLILLVALCSTISFLTTRNRAEKMKLELKTKCWSMIVVLQEFKVYIYELLILKGQSDNNGQ